jgi:hypothetical protein
VRQTNKSNSIHLLGTEVGKNLLGNSEKGPGSHKGQNMVYNDPQMMEENSDLAHEIEASDYDP